MKKTKKLVALILAILISVLFIAGCNSTQSTPQETSDSSQATANSTQDTASAQSENADSQSYTLPLTDTTKTLTYFTLKLRFMPPLDTLGYSSWADFPAMQYAEKLTNVHIEYTEVPMETYQEQFNLIMAGGDYYDIMSMSQYTSGVKRACEDGIILDLTEYIDKAAPNYKTYLDAGDDLSKALKVDGSVYQLMSIYSEYKNNQGLMMRKDWLEKLGLQTPTTLDEMYNVLKAFKTNYNSTNTFGFDNSCSAAGVTSGFEINALNLSGSTSALTYIQRDGAVECSILSDGYREYVEMMNDWYNEGLISKDFMSLTYDPNSTDTRELVGDGQIGVWNGIYETIDQWKEYSEDSNFAVVPVANLVKTKGDKDMVTQRSLLAEGALSVTTSCEDPELAIKYLDFWFSPEGRLIYNYGVPGVSYDLVDGEPQYTDAVIHNNLNVTVTAYLRSQCPYGGMQYGYYENTRIVPYMSDLQKEAWDTWTNCIDGSYAFPSTATLTGEESEENSSISTDIVTYISENLPLFISAEKPMSDWDSFIEGIKGMDVNRCTEIEQAALDRYNGKAA